MSNAEPHPPADAAFLRRLSDEFPDGAAVWDDPVSRRRFLRLMGASLALAGLGEMAGCEKSAPPDQIVPQVEQPEQTLPGRPTYFTSTMPFDGGGRGVLVLSREGRPIKVDGNPDHPATLGGSDVFVQASILDLYDPDRAKTVTQAGVGRPLSELQRQLAARLAASDGRGLRLLTRPVTSPTVAAQLAEVTKRYPQAKWHVHDPLAGAATPFVAPVDVVYDLSAVSVVVSLDADFLFAEPGSLRYARQWSDGRRVRRDKPDMSRLYVAEPAMTITGSMADHRLAAMPAAVIDVARSLAAAVGVDVAGPELSSAMRRWVAATADDLRAAGPGRSVVLPGRFQPPAVHAVAHAINQRLGNVGQTVTFIDPVKAPGAATLAELVDDLHAGAVDTLLVLDGDPAYDAPADSGFAAALSDLTARVNGDQYAALTVHLGTHYTQTSYACQWHVPMAHWLESWGDDRAFDGTASLVQPLIAPLYGGVTLAELLERVLGRADRGGYDVLRDHWRTRAGGDLDGWWLATLQDGVVAGSAAKPRPMPPLRPGVMTAPPMPGKAGLVDLLFRPDPGLWDGRFANNAWLQEAPRPFTKLTWENAVGIGPDLATRLGGLVDGDVVRLTADGRSVEGPVVVVPGQADDAVTLSLGYGRTRGGRVLTDDGSESTGAVTGSGPGSLDAGSGVVAANPVGGRPRGVNAYAVRTAAAPWWAAGVAIGATGKKVTLATTRGQHAMGVETATPGVEPFLKSDVVATLALSPAELALRNRKLIRTVTLPQYAADPRFMDKLAPEERKPLLQLFPNLPKAADLQWGMTIDTTTCMGCNACVVACQAENNIPVVGKTEVIRERAMHWIRIDDYFAGPADDPAVYHQPVPCMHCEDAPCEVVCPVGATTHSPEGINEMTYNRCIGTRFCSNNCPYKVRRFNFLLYSDYSKDSRSLQYNPDVSVRSRGVMEKCTYCIQRIDRTRIESQRETVELRELAAAAPTDAERRRLSALADARGREVVNRLETACQQSCPTRAITFGDVADPNSDVSRTKAEPANYVLLRELTTKPRTSYLARVTNPNPELTEGA